MAKAFLLAFTIAYCMGCSQSVNRQDLPGAVLDKINTEAKEWVAVFLRIQINCI